MRDVIAAGQYLLCGKLYFPFVGRSCSTCDPLCVCVLSCMPEPVWVGNLRCALLSVLRLVKSCVLRPLDRRQASGHTLRCVR